VTFEPVFPIRVIDDRLDPRSECRSGSRVEDVERVKMKEKMQPKDTEFGIKSVQNNTIGI
jgi:hypothetical protein